MDARSHAASFIAYYSQWQGEVSTSGHSGQAMAGSSIFCDIASL